MTTESCTIDVITTDRGFAALEPVWNTLLAASSVAHPFLTYEWMHSWWESFGGGRELRILLVHRGGEPIAIAPLMITTQRLLGRQMCCLQFLANDHTPRCEFLVRPDGEAAYAAIAGHLTSGRPEWDMVALRELPAGSPVIAHLSERAREAGLLSGWSRSYDSPILSLQGHWEQTLAPKRRWFLRNRMKRLSTLGPVALQNVSLPADVPAALEEGFRLEAAAWKGEAGTAMTSDPVVRRFYETFAMRAAARGWLRLQFLTVAGKRIAFASALIFRGRMFLLKPGFDPDFAHYSPGNLLTHLVLGDASQAGLLAYEFLGRDDHWKRQWTTETIGHAWMFLYADRPWARAAHYAKFEVLPALQKLPLYSRLRDSVLHLNWQ